MKLLNRKKLWKSVLGIILSLAIVLSPIPGSSFTVHAADYVSGNAVAGDVYVASVNLRTDSDHKISTETTGVKSGTATLTPGTTPVLTLENFKYDGGCGEYTGSAGFGIFCHNGAGTVKIRLNGTNSIKINATKDQQLLGIYSDPNKYTSIEIEGPGSLEIINGSCTRDNVGIYCCGNLIISNATVIARAGNSSGNWRASTGIRANSGITINDSTVSGIGGDTVDKEQGYGIYGNITMSNSTIFASGKYLGSTAYMPEIPVGCNVTAIGGTYAIKEVKNAIPGTGWDNVEGTGTGVDITINTSGQDIRTYKKVQFLSHEHSFTYQTGTGADANKIIATCSVEGCTLPESSATLTIAAPTLTTYGQTGTGISADAVITDADGIKGDATVKYYKATKSGSSYTKGDALDAAPTGAGDYVAEITLGTATASVGYTIEKAAADAPANAATAGFVPDYETETYVIGTDYEVSSTATDDLTTVESLTGVLDSDNTPIIYIRKKGTDNTKPSDWLSVTLPARPAAPIGLTTTNATNGGTNDGKITGTTADMEYSDENGTTWTDATATETLVRPGTYLVRVKAVSGAPAGRTAVVTVGSNYKALDSTTPVTVTIDPAGHTAPVVGDTLTASCNASDITYQWYRGDTPIQGATTTTYTVTAEDAGQAIKVLVTQTKDSNGDEYLAGSEPTLTGTTSATEKKDAPAAPANAEAAELTLDYTAETFTVNDSYEVSSTNDATGTPLTGLTAALDGTGKVYVRVKETADTKPSEWLEVTLTARPEAPTGLAKENASKEGTADGKITGTSVAMEYKNKESGQEPMSWTTMSEGNTAVKNGTYLIRVKATNDTPAGKTAEVTIGFNSEEKIKPNVPIIEISYTGQPQELVTPGEAEGGTLMYALGEDDKTAPTEGWSENIPTGTDPGTYYVWYKVRGDGDYLDSEPCCVIVKITELTVNTDMKPLAEGKTTSVDTSTKPYVGESLANEAKALSANNNGANVVLNLFVTPQGQSKATESEVLNNDESMHSKVQSQFKDENSVSVDVLDIEITKRIGDESSYSYLKETENVLEIGIAYDFTGKYDPVVIRKHIDENGNIIHDTFKELTSTYEDGRFFADTKNNMLYIYSNRFSTYVVAYSTEENNAQNRTTASSGGSSSSSTTASYPTTIPVYRLFNTVTGQHFYTANKQERDLILEKNGADGWTDEGIAFETAQKTSIPVYRVFDLVNGNHIFTTDAAARDMYIANGCRDEGIAWYAPATVGRKVYKLTETKSNKVTYTTSKAETDMLIEAGFTCEDAEFVVY